MRTTPTDIDELIQDEIWSRDCKLGTFPKEERILIKTAVLERCISSTYLFRISGKVYVRNRLAKDRAAVVWFVDGLTFRQGDRPKPKDIQEQ